MPDPTLYLFDGYNLLHAGGLADERELVDRLAGFVAMRGARGVVVFDGPGGDRAHGPLEVRFAAHADDLIERLAAERRGDEVVCVVSSDRAIRGTSGQEVRHVASKTFLRELAATEAERPRDATARSRIEDALDERTRTQLEAWRRRKH